MHFGNSAFPHARTHSHPERMRGGEIESHISAPLFDLVSQTICVTVAIFKSQIQLIYGWKVNVFRIRKRQAILWKHENNIAEKMMGHRSALQPSLWVPAAAHLALRPNINDKHFPSSFSFLFGKRRQWPFGWALSSAEQSIRAVVIACSNSGRSRTKCTCEAEHIVMQSSKKEKRRKNQTIHKYTIIRSLTKMNLCERYLSFCSSERGTRNGRR